MIIPFFIAFLLAFFIGVAHSYLGEKWLVIPLLRYPSLPPIQGSDDFTRKTIRYAWHITTIAVWAIAAVFLVFVFKPLDEVSVWIVHILAATFLVCALASFVFTHGRHLSWIVFVLISISAWWGLFI